MRLPQTESNIGASRPSGHASHVDGRTPGAHTVQFYENDHFLAAAVADFLCAGLESDQPTVVIATEARREGFTVRLKAKGIDVPRMLKNGRLRMVDARATLDAFMDGPMPDPVRFRAAVGEVLEQCQGGSPDVVRAYGEMVDVLWKDGHTDAAIRVEELWNDLAATHRFSLLCAYAMGNFYKSSDAGRIEDVCRQHQHVIPTERFVEADESAQLAEITLLQQRAQALETEIGHRKELEQRLREALSSRRIVEAALRESEQHLKRIATERERLLESERAARAEAEAANRAKSEFLAVMSHELRTPLNAIAGHVQLIEMGLYGTVSDAQRESLGRIARSQRHLLSLINDVLNLSRIETGRMGYATEEVVVDELVRDVIAMLDPLISAGRLTCEFTTEWTNGGPPLTVRADRDKLRQILLNLVHNAIKFTPPEGHITVEAGPCRESTESACIRVRDTGVGIDPTKLQTIFEPFVQLEARLANRPEGVGLGLTISRDLTRGMGGDISVTSTVGEGTTFVLELPVAGGR